MVRICWVYFFHPLTFELLFLSFMWASYKQDITRVCFLFYILSICAFKSLYFLVYLLQFYDYRNTWINFTIFSILYLSFFVVLFCFGFGFFLKVFLLLDWLSFLFSHSIFPFSMFSNYTVYWDIYIYIAILDVLTCLLKLMFKVNQYLYIFSPQNTKIIGDR